MDEITGHIQDDIIWCMLFVDFLVDETKWTSLIKGWSFEKDSWEQEF